MYKTLEISSSKYLLNIYLKSTALQFQNKDAFLILLILRDH